ncbi:MAG: DUF1963 domain-containing protein [Bacteroidales bacterium]|nr:DUF1963 domain-containing protein [Bacteroidales bacterium]
MAIRLNLQKTERILFCGSKWWGDPDMPENMQYPTIEAVDEDGEKMDYPLTFICQINCEDMAPFDKEGKLPHEGMLYFFGAIDEYLGYGSPVENAVGEWPKGHFVVKYAKSINFETFQSCILVDDEDQSLTEPELEITFSECEDGAEGHLMLACGDHDATGMVHLLRLVSDEKIGLLFNDGAALDVMIKESDLKYGNWKKAKAFLRQNQL